MTLEPEHVDRQRGELADALRAQDGHAARELLNSWRTTAGQNRALSNVLDASGLAGTGLPGRLRERLENAVAVAAIKLDKGVSPAVTGLHRPQ